MPAIVPALLRDAYKLTASFYEAGIDCPPIVDLNRWLLSQPLAIGGIETTAPTAAPTAAPLFDDALTAALKSSPRGVEIGDLRAILTAYNKTGAQIGAALGRMAKGGTAEKKGELWFWKAPATVDRRLNQRHRTATPASAAGEASGEGEGEGELQRAAG